ncbi:hypothetical protein TNCV_4900871 [Trichonephila clavipes]|nr:hypothetical protein TNCV_4900871 [Trichonephila clavipes]
MNLMTLREEHKPNTHFERKHQVHISLPDVVNTHTNKHDPIIANVQVKQEKKDDPIVANVQVKQEKIYGLKKFIEKKVETPKRQHQQRIKREQPFDLDTSDSSDLDTSDSSDLDTSDSEGFDSEISTPDSSDSESSSSDSDSSSSDSDCSCAKRRKLTPTIWSVQLGYRVTQVVKSEKSSNSNDSTPAHLVRNIVIDGRKVA